MVHFEVDPDSLTAAAEVAGRQHDHVGAVSDYIDGACSRFDAFSGVLNIFEGNYRDTVHNAQQGMQASKKVADKVAETFTACRHDYLESDRSSHRVFVKLFGDEMALPPYAAPGQRRHHARRPGLPRRRRPARRGRRAVRAGEAAAVDERPVQPRRTRRPEHAAARPVAAHLRQGQGAGVRPRRADAADDYLDYRSQGMTRGEALSHAQRDVDSVADGRVYDSMQDRQAEALTQAYDDAITDGKSPDEARQAGHDAASDQRQADSVRPPEPPRRPRRGRHLQGRLRPGLRRDRQRQRLVEDVEQLHETTTTSATTTTTRARTTTAAPRTGRRR